MPIVSPSDVLILILMTAIWFVGVAALLVIAEKLSHLRHRH